MEFTTPGIWSGTNRSARILREINNNNRISLRIRAKFKEVNQLTTLFLTNQLANYSQQQSHSHSHSEPEEKLFKILQKTFQDIYYLLDIEDFKFNKLSTIDLKKLHSYYSQLNEVEFNLDLSVADVNDELTINATTLQLINYYVLLTSTLKLSNSVIYKTLELKNQYVYWSDIKSSNFNKLIYLIQSLPYKLYIFGKNVIEHLEIHPTNDTTHSLTNYDKQGTEEDNDIYFSWIRIKKSISRFYEAISKTFGRSFTINNPSFSLSKISAVRSNTRYYLDWIKFIWKYPINLINNDLNEKLSKISKQIEENTGKIDLLIKTNLNDKESTLEALESISLNNQSQSIDNEFSTKPDIQRLNDILINIIRFDSINYYETEIPSPLSRYWPIILATLVYGPSQSIKLYSNREEIIDWLKFNLIDTVTGFFKNWVIKPINDLLNTLRSDDTLSITTKESLKSDLDSLERMIIEFAQDETSNPPDAQQIHEAIQNGDLTLVMNQYESQIKTPVKSLLKGNLIRSILIQIQKTKVDGGYAINGIDKILKSQQLVFGFVSITPSLFILYQFWSYLSSTKPIFVNGKQVNIICLKSLNNIESLLVLINNQVQHTSSSDEQFTEYDKQISKNYEGQLLIEIINLIVVADLIIPKALKSDWINDLNELNNNDFDITTKLQLVRKIWNMYGHYFR
ncbi:ATP synthase regulation protein NCA2-domain-containing protein [Scheffersomyces amazonensis]|uniref:ATP synthase regulation protein NCA2-domain-containing protein n=1 Tax=Scheffersomyces amazonensis TaxID=1078765 RepID=UPI00315CD401